jgi:hypothetical protein
LVGNARLYGAFARKRDGSGPSRRRDAVSEHALEALDAFVLQDFDVGLVLAEGGSGFRDREAGGEAEEDHLALGVGEVTDGHEHLLHGQLGLRQFRGAATEVADFLGEFGGRRTGGGAPME